MVTVVWGDVRQRKKAESIEKWWTFTQEGESGCP